MIQEQINTIIERGEVAEVELAHLMFPSHLHPIAALNAVRSGTRELKASEILMLDRLTDIQVAGQFFCAPFNPDKPGVWLRTQNYVISIIGDIVSFYIGSALMYTHIAPSDQPLSECLIDCLTIMKRLDNESEN